MPVIKITEADRLKSKTADSQWYGMTITKMEMKSSKTEKSMNFWAEFTLDAPAEGKVLKVCFNTAVEQGSILGTMQMKSYSDLVGLIAMYVEGSAPDEFDTDELVGFKVDGKVDVKIAEGSPINIITSFLPYGTGKNQKAPF
jgi:hypothetical protein